jgi:hypothetical protein
VLPYAIGLELGAVWEDCTVPVTLTGNLAQQEARALVVSAVVGHFPPVRLAFAWTRAANVPVLLGQVNFFMEFDVCFYRSQPAFEVRPKRPKA